MADVPATNDKQIELASNLANAIGTYTAELKEIGRTDIPVDFTLTSGDITAYDKISSALDSTIGRRPEGFVVLGDFDKAPPEAPDTGIASNVERPYVSDFSGTKPVVNLPVRPTMLFPDVPVKPPLDDVPIPELSSQDMPELPDLDLTFPPIEMDKIELPKWAAILPQDTLTDPTYEFNFSEVDYTSELGDAMYAKLLGDVENGGYGIEPADEEALRNRAQDALSRDAVTARDNLLVTFAGTGFTLPTGASVAAMQKSFDDAADKIAEEFRNIEINRAELFRQNRQFALSTSLQVEQMLRNYHNAVMERALNVANALVQAGIAITDAHIRVYHERIAAYQTQADVYRTQMDAARLGVEIYKARIDARNAELGTQKILVDIYIAEVEGIKAVNQVYLQNVEISKLIADINRLKIEAYKASVEGYAAKISGIRGQFEAYKTAIEGEKLKVDIYAVEAQAYDSIVRAAKVKLDIEALVQEIQVKVKELDIAIYNSQSDAWKNAAQLEVQRSEMMVKQQSMGVQSYIAELGAYAKAAELGIMNSKAMTETDVQRVHAAIEQAKVTLGALEYQVGNRMVAAKAGADVYGSLTKGAMDSITTISHQADIKTSK